MKLIAFLKSLFTKKQIISSEPKQQKELKWCSVWAAPNKIWGEEFAHNKPDDDLHPSVVLELLNDEITCRVIPGTSKDYKKGRKCTYSIKLKSHWKDSFFLINKSITQLNEDVMQFHHGWGEVKELNDKQKDGLYRQALVCSDMRTDIRPKNK